MNAKRTDPLVPAGHPDFRWTSGADVQATWRRYGWEPPSELLGRVIVPAPAPAKEPEWLSEIRRVK